MNSSSSVFSGLLLLMTSCATVALLAACSGNEAKKPPPAARPALVTPTEKLARARHRIDSLDGEIRKSLQTPDKQPDVRLAMHAIKAYHYFALDFPQDSRAAEALDRAGQLYGGVLGNQQKAAEFYEKAYQQYPQYPARARLLFQEGVAYDAADDTANAIGAWRRLLVAYPGHALSKEAQGLIRLARMTDGERRQFLGQQPPADAGARR